MIAFVAAERLEFSGLEKHLAEWQSLPWPVAFAATGLLNGKRVLLAANGPGPRLAAEIGKLLRTERLEALVSVGFCGALAESLAASEVFIGTSVNGMAISSPRGAPRASYGSVLSLARVVTTAKEKKRLRESGADVVEMEAGEVCGNAPAGTPCFCVRVVTDTADENLPMDFNSVRDSSGRFSRTRIAAHAVRHPFTLIPELVQLNRRCRNAALVLGDFLANCQF